MMTMLVTILCGCESERLNAEAQIQLKNGNYEKAIQVYEEAVTRYPKDVTLRSGLVTSKETVFVQLMNSAAQARSYGNDNFAEISLKRALAINPNDDRAKSMLLDVQRDRRQKEAVINIQDLISKGFPERALLAVEAALKDSPKNEELLSLQRQLELNQKQVDQTAMRLAETRPISLDFRDANLRMVLEVLTRNSGVNFVLDKDIRADLRTTIYLKNTRLEDALELITATSQLAYKVLDTATVLIYPKTSEKAKEYEDLVIRAFYLSNANAKQTAQLLKSMLKIRDPFVDEKLNLIIVRETPQVLRLAERVIALYDVSEPEVMLEVEVLEIQRNSLTNLGVDLPDTLTLTPIVPASSNSSTSGNTTGSSTTSTSTNGFTLSTIKGIRSSTIGVNTPSVTINLHKDISDANILANPKLRTRNHEKAKIMVGDKLPVVTTTGSANNTGFISESVQYVDVGLKLDIEPTVYLDDDVGIKLALEVSSLVNTIKTTAGSTVYEIGTRNVETVLKLHDGETQLMAGLINNSEQTAAKKVPGLGDMPVLGRLFSTQSNNGQRSEIVLSITPHIIRNIRRPDINQAEFWSGTENDLRSRPLTLPGRSKPKEVKNDAAAPINPNLTPANTLQPQVNSAQGGATSMPADHTPDIVVKLDAPTEVKVNESFTVNLIVNANKALRGMPIQLNYLPANLELVKVEEGPFLKQDGTTVSQSKTVEPGKLSIGLLRSTANDIKGNGTLLTMTFKALSAGQAEIRLASARGIATDPIEPIVLPAASKINIK